MLTLIYNLIIAIGNNITTLLTNVGLVKAKTDIIGDANPTVSDTTTVMNYLKKLDSKGLGDFSGKVLSILT